MTDCFHAFDDDGATDDGSRPANVGFETRHVTEHADLDRYRRFAWLLRLGKVGAKRNCQRHDQHNCCSHVLCIL